MGLLPSRQRDSAEEDENISSQVYRYPPKSGLYFGSTFIMGGERFESTQPEAYLFGENSDLNFLGCRAVQFPYPSVQHSNEPTKVLQSLVNIRRDSIKFVRCLPSKHGSIHRSHSSGSDSLLAVPHAVESESLADPVVDKPLKDPMPFSSAKKSDIHLKKHLAKVAPSTFAGTGEKSSKAKQESKRKVEENSLNSDGDEMANNNGVDVDANNVDNVSECDATSRRLTDSDAGSSHSSEQHIERYNIEFVFDCDCPVSIRIKYFATEELASKEIQYVSKRPELSSMTYHFPAGANQLFSSGEHFFEPALYKKEELQYTCELEVIPVVIQCIAENNSDIPQVHSTLAVVEPSAEGNGFVLKPLKQKLYTDGVCFLLQEVYGIENKNISDAKVPADDYSEDIGTDCVICMSELRDTLILPCRHLCLCNACAETLRYKASNCPICRSPFRALLQIKAVRRTKCATFSTISSDHNEQASSETGFLSRYETVSLIEALNGPIASSLAPMPPHAHKSLAVNQDKAQASHTRSKGKRKSGRSGRPISPIQEVLRSQVVPLDTASPADQPTPSSRPVSGATTTLSRSAGASSVCDSLPGSVLDAAENPNTVGYSRAESAKSFQSLREASGRKKRSSVVSKNTLVLVSGPQLEVEDYSDEESASNSKAAGRSSGITKICIDRQYTTGPKSLFTIVDSSETVQQEDCSISEEGLCSSGGRVPKCSVTSIEMLPLASKTLNSASTDPNSHPLAADNVNNDEEGDLDSVEIDSELTKSSSSGLLAKAGDNDSIPVFDSSVTSTSSTKPLLVHQSNSTTIDPAIV